MMPEIRILSAKKLIGKRLAMSFSQNTTFDLWRSFMPCRNEIQNNIGTDLYSIQIYSPLFFENFNPGAHFEKWAAMEVADFKTIPADMEIFTLTGGLYAVFQYRGAASAGAKVFQYILANWLPQSGYILDNRPHFEILGDRYKQEDPDSEEEIWIPIRMDE